MTAVLSILKIIAIAAAGITGLVLFIVILLLLIPFRYKAAVSCHDKKLNAEAQVCWFLRAVSMKYVRKDDGTQNGVLRLFGVQILKFDNKDKAGAEKEEKDGKEINIRKIAGSIIRAFKEAPEGPLGRLDLIRRRLTAPEWHPVYKKTAAGIRRIIKDIFPKDGKGILIFGTDDPVLTGRILEILAVFFPFYGEIIEICPEFDSNVLTADLDVKGNIHAGKILLNGALIVFSRKSRKFYREFKRLLKNEREE